MASPCPFVCPPLPPTSPGLALQCIHSVNFTPPRPALPCPTTAGYHGSDQSEGRLLQEAERIGFPLLVKAVSGGGGKGMKLATAPSELKEAIASAKREAASSFGDDRVLLERYIGRPRHVEVQVSYF